MIFQEKKQTMSLTNERIKLTPEERELTDKYGYQFKKTNGQFFVKIKQETDLWNPCTAGYIRETLLKLAVQDLNIPELNKLEGAK